MKNKIIIFLIGLFLLPISVSAKNRIYNIDMHINVTQDGSANITETWDVDGDDGTEWYKVLNNLGESEVSNFKVSMDGRELTYKDWNVDESLSQKRGYYGINYTSNGLELCFGKYDYNRHKFTLNYTISNFVFNTEDSQVIYFNLIDKLSDVDIDNFSVTLSSYYSFPDTLDVWGYGYKGYAYVNNGIIGMSNEENSDMNGEYVVLLAKFPLNTFTNNIRYSQFNKFNDVLTLAEKGSYEYNYEDSWWVKILIFILENMFFIISLVIFVIVFIVARNSGYGYKNNKKINKKEVNMFRDIPCNKDIYYANVLIKLNNFDYKNTNIFGAIILKWVREKKIIFKTEEKGIFNKETSIIDLTLNPAFDNLLEKKLFDIMKEASVDGFLETKELEKWSKKNYTKFFELFDDLVESEITKLETNNHIYIRADKNECKKKNVMDDTIYDDSVKLYGLKKYLIEFSNMKEKQVFDVHLWDEYLMFAYLFGIADKVAKQLKDMYPEVVQEMQNSNIDYSTLYYINHISTRSTDSASSARSAAQSYSSGGGGFSSGGGGGGSFGGGGGGSR